MWKLVFINKNLEILKIIVIFKNEHDKNQTKMLKFDFWVWRMSKMTNWTVLSVVNDKMIFSYAKKPINFVKIIW